MDKSVIDSFWKKRAAAGKGRWTEHALLDFELAWLSQLIPSEARILDLGSGPGELSSRLLPPQGQLTLVEKYPDFLKLAPTGQNIRHVCCDVLNFANTERFDVILLFGVVTHLTVAEETLIYRTIAGLLAHQGVLIVKNQVSCGEEKLVSGYSNGLQQEYCGRYPGLDSQRERLSNVFSDVRVVHYPHQFNPWPDTKHTAFVCLSS